MVFEKFKGVESGNPNGHSFMTMQRKNRLIGASMRHKIQV